MKKLFLLFFATMIVFATTAQKKALRIDAPQVCNLGISDTDFGFVEVKDCLGVVSKKSDAIKACIIDHDEKVDDAHDIICSKVEYLEEITNEGFDDVVDEINETESILCSKIEDLEGTVESVSDTIVTEIDETESVLCSKLEQIEDTMLSVSDAIVTEIDETESILCSKIENIEVSVPSCSDQIISEIDGLESVLCSKIESLESDDCCCCDVVITQDMIPFTITTPGVYCLGEDVSSDSDAVRLITIASNNVTLDLCGHTVTYTGEGPQAIGVYAKNFSKITVKNGVICSTDQGVCFSNVALFKIENMKIKGIELFGVTTGINLEVCSGGVVKDVLTMITTIGTPDIGFNLSDSSNIFFFQCISNGESTGFKVDNSNDNIFKCCVANNGSIGFNIGGLRNEFHHCIAKNNSEVAFRLLSTSFDNEVTSCTAIGNGFGIDNSGTNSHIYNNRSNANGTDYAGVSAVVASGAVTSDTGYWSNIST